MFEKLRSAFTGLAEALRYRVPSPKELEETLWGFELALLESDVAQEVAEELVGKVRGTLEGIKVRRGEGLDELVKTKLREELERILKASGTLDLRASIETKRRGKVGREGSNAEPYVVIFLGINGTGKTTSLAKLAKLVKGWGYSVVMGCSDTHRAGAIEQLSQHAQRLAIRVIAQRYGADPAAVARDAVLYAKNHRVDVVLIDTAGRMQTSRNLMEEMGKIIRVVRPDLKIFIADALAGNDAVSQAKEFLAYTDFDATILTKVDADAKGGAGISIVYLTKRPILYLGVGQGYDDLRPFDPVAFARLIMEGNGRVE